MPPPPPPMWQSSPSFISPQAPPGPAWVGLRLASVLLKIFAFLALFAGTGASYLAAQATHNSPGVVLADVLIGLVASSLVCVFFYAIGDLLMLLVHIERNTRR